MTFKQVLRELIHLLDEEIKISFTDLSDSKCIKGTPSMV